MSELDEALQSRLRDAEMTAARVRDWINLMADRGPAAHLVARELCLLLGWAAPRPKEPMCSRCGATVRSRCDGIH